MSAENNLAVGGVGLPRYEIIRLIGSQYYDGGNIEGGEFSYRRALGRAVDGHFKLDIRFYDPHRKVAVLVETKQKISKRDKKQLFAYVALEQEYQPANKIIAILAGTKDSRIAVWKISGDHEEELDDVKIKSLEEYATYFQERNTNDRNAVLDNTAKLNKILHDNGIDEKLRSQFVGTCMLALKNGLVYKSLLTAQIIAGIKGILESMLGNEPNVDKATKIAVLYSDILQNSKVENLKPKDFSHVLTFIKDNIVPYIDDTSYEGHDILSYFFTTFNKYVGKGNKNQAYTPNHIAHFMCKVAGISRNSRVLDPTCGSGTFLVQAMTQALAKCETDEERKSVRRNQIFGIEVSREAFGLSTTNMLIHGDGNSNIIKASCFDKAEWIHAAKASVILMNPPYNASKAEVDDAYKEEWGKAKTDPTKGLYFVYRVAEMAKSDREIRLVALLPMQCVVGTSGVIQNYKRAMLNNHTLDAVFSMPSEMFYPGANAVACCLVFKLGTPHNDSEKETFFGYYRDDGFKKRKNIGRVDIKDSWKYIEQEWLSLYEHREKKQGKSLTKKVTADDEWCIEAYLDTDYSQLNEESFEKVMRDYIAFQIQTSDLI